MDTSFETDYIQYILEQGIIIANYKPGIRITLAIARQIVEARLLFTHHQKYPVLIDSQGVVSMDREAREFLSSPQGTEGLKAAAIVVHSPFSSFLGNFFLWVNKPEMPVKIFTNTDPALKWLNKFIS